MDNELLMNQGPIIPIKKRRDARDRIIRTLYNKGKGLSMDEICVEMQRLGQGVSKTTVFFAINGRSTKKMNKKREDRKKVKKYLNK